MTGIGLHSVPKLRRGIIRKFDAARGQHVLLGPERVILLDEIGNAIAELCDGGTAIAEICHVLSERYAAEPAQVEPDILGFVQELLDKDLVTA